MISSDITTKELFEYIRTLPLNNIPTLKSILSGYNLTKIDAVDLIRKMKLQNNDILLIDSRSEKEFEESHLPFAKNFPVLSSSERHNVGLIYKKYSQSAALQLAMQYADPKAEELKKFLQENSAESKEIFIYCWRGGGRSSYLAKMIIDAGYKPVILTGGHKAYRRMAVDFFEKEFPYGLIELTGLTGSGKTELLRSVKEKIPVVDLEEAAHHFSSLFGEIPYLIKNIKPVSNQSAFENNIFRQIILNDSGMNNFLIESESKRVGSFDIPEKLFRKMSEAPAIEIRCSFELRIERIRKDYFGNSGKGIDEMMKILIEKEKFFTQQLSKDLFTKAIGFLNEGRVEEYIELMMFNYYDKRYKKKNKKPLLIIENDDPDSAQETLMSIYFSYIKEKPMYPIP